MVTVFAKKEGVKDGAEKGLTEDSLETVHSLFFSSVSSAFIGLRWKARPCDGSRLYFVSSFILQFI